MDNIQATEFKQKQLYMLKKVLKHRFRHYSPNQEADIIKVCEDTNIIDAFARMDYWTEINRQESLKELQENPFKPRL